MTIEQALALNPGDKVIGAIRKNHPHKRRHTDSVLTVIRVALFELVNKEKVYKSALIYTAEDNDSWQCSLLELFKKVQND